MRGKEVEGKVKVKVKELLCVKRSVLVAAWLAKHPNAVIRPGSLDPLGQECNALSLYSGVRMPSLGTDSVEEHNDPCDRR